MGAPCVRDLGVSYHDSLESRGIVCFLGGASLSMAPLYLLGETLSLMMWSSTGEGNLIIRVCYELHEAYFIIFSMHILVTL